MGDSVRLVRGTAYGDAKSSCAPGFSGVRRSAAAPDLVTLFVAPHLMQALWPKDVFEMRPNINDAISCFLGPASLVYAIAFGFAMQVRSVPGPIVTSHKRPLKTKDRQFDNYAVSGGILSCNLS